MASSIDITKPESGSATTASVRANFQAAKTEIEALQADVLTKQPLATVLTNTTASFTTVQETKLAGIATGATANSSDATLLNRANHTGSQAISTVTGLQTALDGKQPLATVLTNTTASYTIAEQTKLAGIATGATANSPDATLLARVNHTGTQAISTVTGLQTALDGKEPTITAGTISQYYRGDKSFQALDKTAVGLANVDNTSDATKNSATATLTNKTISGASNTITNIAQSSVTNLTTDLAARATLSANNVFTGRNRFAATIGAWQTDTFAATEVLDASIQFGVINITSAFTMDSVTGAGAAGEAQVLYREFRQGATPFSISSWNTTNFEKVGASFPALTNTANARDFMTFTRSQNGKWLVTAGLNVS